MTSVGLTPVSNSKESGASEEVTLDDQRKINRFAQLNSKEEELDQMLKDLKRRLENIEEASNDLILADDDDLEAELAGDETVASKDLSNIHFKLGEAFISVNKDEAEVLLDKKRDELKNEIRAVERRIGPMKEEMSTIKAKLYAKFGNNINLDNDEEA